jgi:hypothetical protein
VIQLNKTFPLESGDDLNEQNPNAMKDRK